MINLKFVDATVFIHAYLKPSRKLEPHEKELKKGARQIIERIENGEKVTTSVVHFTETANILEDSDGIKKIENDKIFLFDREDPGSRIWTGQTEERTPDVKFDVIYKNSDEQIVGGVVYMPLTYDADGEWATDDTIQNAMYYWMEEGMEFSVDHEKEINANVLECFQAEEDTIKGNGTVPEGTWYVAARIEDDEVWERIKSGDLRGWSWEGKVIRERGQSI